MSRLDIDEVIEDFWQSRQAGVHFPSQWLTRLTSLDEAYRVQLGLMARLVSQGFRHIDWKVGLTSEPMQQQFHVHEPVFGYLLDDAPNSSGASFSFDRLIQPGFENEICVTMASSFSPGAGEPAVRMAIAGVQPALEVVENRGDFTRYLAVAVADNVQQKAIVLGPATKALPPDLDLANVRAVVTINGQTVAEATSSAVLGNPLRSVVWLANKLAEFDLGLEAGQLVMTGSLTRQFAVNRGDNIATLFDGLGSVEASFI